MIMLTGDLGVHLSSRDVSVPQKFLHVAQVSPFVQQVRGKRVAQGVRSDILVQARCPDVTLNE
jgi:hypothetical protein